MKLITVIVPCYNEGRHIRPFLQSILAQDIGASNIELFIFDGFSTDSTRPYIEEFISDFGGEFRNIKLFDNPSKNKASALNKGIGLSNGHYLMRADVHALYEPNYITILLDLIEQHGFDNVGAVRQNTVEKDDFFSRTLLMVFNDKIALGKAPHYLLEQGIVETDIVHLFFCRAKLFDEVGLFDERLLRGQDREFNLRLKGFGKRAAVTSRTKSYYFIRDKKISLFKWMFWNGVTPFRISKIVGKSLLHVRNFFPLMLLAIFVVGILINIYFTTIFFATYLTAIWVLYFAKSKSPSMAMSATLLTIALHLTYGVGSMYGLISRR